MTDFKSELLAAAEKAKDFAANASKQAEKEIAKLSKQAKKAQRQLAKAAKKSEPVKAVQAAVAKKDKKKGLGFGGWFLVGSAVAAVAALGYALWQTFRADDDLWIADEELDAPVTSVAK